MHRRTRKKFGRGRRRRENAVRKKDIVSVAAKRKPEWDRLRSLRFANLRARFFFRGVRVSVGVRRGSLVELALRDVARVGSRYSVVGRGVDGRRVCVSSRKAEADLIVTRIRV